MTGRNRALSEVEMRPMYISCTVYLMYLKSAVVSIGH